MQKYEIRNTEIEGLVMIMPFRADDLRGNFIKDYSLQILQENGINFELKEVFYTTSVKGVIRAIHFQNTVQQGKLVRVIKGKVFDVCVDLRKKSKTFGKWLGFELSDENNISLLIPEGFGHGYLVLEDSIVSYKCNQKFYGEYDDGIIWNDKTIDIKWPTELVENIILSEKDKSLQSFKNFVEKN